MEFSQQAIIEASQKHQKIEMERRTKNSPLPAELSPGTYVVLKWPNNRPPNKLSARWRGPYRVLEPEERTNQYKLMDLKTKEEVIAHLEDMKIYDVSRLIILTKSELRTMRSTL